MRAQEEVMYVLLETEGRVILTQNAQQNCILRFWKELLSSELGCIAGDVIGKNTGGPACFLLGAYSKHGRGETIEEKLVKIKTKQTKQNKNQTPKQNKTNKKTPNA